MRHKPADHGKMRNNSQNGTFDSILLMGSTSTLLINWLRNCKCLTVCSLHRQPAKWAGRKKGRSPGRTAFPSHTPQLWRERRCIWTRSHTRGPGGGCYAGLTVNSRRNHDVQDLGAIASINQLIWTERVEPQGATTSLIFRFYHHHHIKAVVGKVFSLKDTVKWVIMWSVWRAQELIPLSISNDHVKYFK